jgi:hypothetical protein
LTTATTEATARTYTAMVTGAQVFSYADLARRLGQAYGADYDYQLHQDMVDVLFALLYLTPEPTEEDGDDYLSAMKDGQVPSWGRDDAPLTETPAEWTARARASRDAGPATWPGLAADGAARYAMPLSAAEILSFEALTARLARHHDGDALVVRHDLWTALQSFADLLPEPSEPDVADYLARVAAGELTDWNTVPLTETTEEWVARTRARRAAEGEAE